MRSAGAIRPAEHECDKVSWRWKDWNGRNACQPGKSRTQRSGLSTVRLLSRFARNSTLIVLGSGVVPILWRISDLAPPMSWRMVRMHWPSGFLLRSLLVQLSNSRWIAGQPAATDLHGSRSNLQVRVLVHPTPFP